MEISVMKPKPQEASSDFKGMCRVMQAIARDEDGVTAIEYGLLAALIVVVAVGSITALGGGVDGMWTDISAQVSAAL
jgi:pilus assembly protein Flp/PilA